MEAGEHTSELGQWQTAQRPADPRLRAYVHGYFASSSNPRIPIQERHLPSTEVPLLLNFGAPHRRWVAEGAGEWTARNGVWIVGMHNRHQLTKASESGTSWLCDSRPWTLLRFNRVVRSLDRLSGTRANELVSKPYIETKQPEDSFVDAIQWADLAADCGYVDQLHLIKDFREFTGMTPNAFVRHVSFLN